MGRPSKVEDEPGAFKVLLCLSEGDKTPKMIAEELGLAPSTVIFHLNRLRKKGFVERLEKLGKTQPYRVKWPTVLGFFLETCIPTLTFPELKEKKGLEQFESLVNDSNFKRLVQEGLNILRNLLKENPKTVNFGLESYFKAFRNTLTQFKMEDFNLEGCTPLFQSFIKKLVATRHYDEKSWRWIQTLKSLGILKTMKLQTNK